MRYKNKCTTKNLKGAKTPNFANKTLKSVLQTENFQNAGLSQGTYQRSIVRWPLMSSDTLETVLVNQKCHNYLTRAQKFTNFTRLKSKMTFLTYIMVKLGHFITF